MNYPIIPFFYLIAVFIFTTFSTAQYAGQHPKGLMIQLHTWWHGTTGLETILKNICHNHRNLAAPGYINNLVLQDVSKPDESANLYDPNNNPPANDVLLTDLLNVLLPYFPGENGPCTFDNIFVGTLDLQKLHPDAYKMGIQDSNYRWNVLRRSKVVAQKFSNFVASSSNPGVIYNWYSSYEALLDFFTTTYVKDCYQAYLLQHFQDLTTIRNGTALLWSPGFQNSPASMPDKNLLTINLKSFFTELRSRMKFNSYRNFGDPLSISMQDHARAPQTQQDALTWFQYLKNNFGPFTFTSLDMNVEQFRVRPNGALGSLT